jgi:MioC protein
LSIVILFGTESGNAELIASEIADAIGERFAVSTRDMSEADPAELSPNDFHLVVCSTHGDGELPSGARPFGAALEQCQLDLHGIRYAMFGLGDSSYDNYSRGSEILDELLSARGGERMGAYGRYDASSHDDPIQVARQWAGDLLKEEHKEDGHD